MGLKTAKNILADIESLTQKIAAPKVSCKKLAVILNELGVFRRVLGRVTSEGLK